MKKRIEAFFDRLLKNIRRPEMLVLPGQLAFFFVLTIAPIIGLVLSIIGKLNISYELVDDIINSNIPTQLAQIIESIVTNNTDMNFIFFFVSSLVLASSGTFSIITASNTIYGINSNSYIKRRIKALVMMIVLILLLLFILLIPVFGDSIIKMICLNIKGIALEKLVGGIYSILKHPISLFCVFFAVKVLYTMAPDKKIESRNTTYGAIFTSIMWVVVTNIYAIYVGIANYSSLYGNLSQIIVLMWWVYILAYIFVLGMALNVSKYQMDK